MHSVAKEHSIIEIYQFDFHSHHSIWLYSYTYHQHKNSHLVLRYQTQTFQVQMTQAVKRYNLLKVYTIITSYLVTSIEFKTQI